MNEFPGFSGFIQRVVNPQQTPIGKERQVHNARLPFTGKQTQTHGDTFQRATFFGVPVQGTRPVQGGRPPLRGSAADIARRVGKMTLGEAREQLNPNVFKYLAEGGEFPGIV